MTVRQRKRTRRTGELHCVGGTLYRRQGQMPPKRGLHLEGAQMAKRPGTNPKNEWAFFDVVYEDGTQRSNRLQIATL